MFCMTQSGTIYDFSVATDGTPYITNRDPDLTYRLSDEDQARLWQIFDLVQDTMGYDASFMLDF